MSETSTQPIFRNSNFRMLWLGQGISILGDQFYLIALPWLVLQLTNDPFAVGSVLALAGIPRALFMLVGGALTDRFSPRRLMMLSNTLSLVLVSALAVLVYTEATQLWMLYGFALAFGVVDAFYFPASSAILPSLVKDDQLAAGNAIIQGTNQLGLFAGPVLAGGLIAVLADSSQVVNGEAVPGMIGITAAFVFDALTFLAANIALSFIKLPQQAVDSQDDDAQSSVWASIREGLASVWDDITLRVAFIVIAGINLLVTGPIMVGIPVIADTRLPDGAAAFGIAMSAYGGGALIGTILSGVIPIRSPRYMGGVLMGLTGIMGVGVALIGLAQTTFALAAIGLLMGVVEGYVVIQFVTWLQRRTSAALLGRVMSVLMFSSVGLVPVATMLSGALITINVTVFFIVSGALLASLTTAAALTPAIQAMGKDLVPIEKPTIADAIRSSTEMAAVTRTSTGEFPAVSS